MMQRRYQVRRRQQRPGSPWVALVIPFLAVLLTAGAFYLLADFLGGGAASLPTPAAPTPTATPLVQATATPLPTATPAPTATPDLPTPTAIPAGSDVLRVGGDATVNAETGLRVRSGPGTTFDPVVTLPAGTIVEVIGGPERADTYTWWQIRFPSADGGTLEGWAAGDFLDAGAG